MRVEIKGLSKTYKKKRILNQVDLNIEGIYGLIGPNGAGKTTFMKILSGLETADHGSVTINGEPFFHRKQMKRNHLIGYLSQDFMVYPEVPVYEVLNHIAVLQGFRTQTERQQIIMESVRKVNLEGHVYKKMVELSGGMRRRVGIAQLLMRRPKLLLFDEPTAGLDIEERIRFRTLLKQLGSDHTIIISSHIVEDIEFLCTKIGVLKEGLVQFEGSPEQLKEHAKDLIYETTIHPSQLDEFLLSHEVVQITETKEGLLVRVFSSDPLSFRKAIPRLSEGYLSVVRGRDYATT